MAVAASRQTVMDDLYVLLEPALIWNPFMPR